jgi:hypothetical protein
VLFCADAACAGAALRCAVQVHRAKAEVRELQMQVLQRSVHALRTARVSSGLGDEDGDDADEARRQGTEGARGAGASGQGIISRRVVGAALWKGPGSRCAVSGCSL